VPEASRSYLNQKMAANSSFRYNKSDLLAIAREQQAAEDLCLADHPAQLVCDTDLLVIIIWCEVRFGHCHRDILTLFDSSIARHNRHYLLCDCDIPWQADPLREHADSRPELFALYEQKLDFYNLPYTIMSGSEQERLASALELANSGIH